MLKESAGSLLKRPTCGKHTIKELREKLAFYGMALVGDIVVKSSAGVALTHDIPKLCEKVVQEVRSMNKVLKDIQFRLHDLEEVISKIISNENYKNNR